MFSVNPELTEAQTRTNEKTLTELEIEAFWRLNLRLWHLFRADPFDPEIDELRADLELMIEMTECDMVREACRRCVELDEKLRRPLLRGAERMLTRAPSRGKTGNGSTSR